MALTKARGFTRGKSYEDLRAMAGGFSVVPVGNGNAGLYTFLGRGTSWTNTQQGSVQRGFGYTTTVYPTSASNDSSQYVCYVEDMGSLDDFYASGGFCVSMKVRLLRQQWQALGSDGTSFICADTTASMAQSTDLLNYTRVTNTVEGTNVGYASGRVQYVNGTIIASSGSQYITQGTAVGGTWTTLTSTTTQSNMTFVGGVFHNGQYYLYGWNNSVGGAIFRTSGTAWTLTGGTMVYNAGSTLNAVEHMDWFDDVGCFLGACTRNRASAQAQAGIIKSVNGTTWTDAYIGGLTTGVLSVATNGTGTAVAVGYGGFIVTSTDGTATTWTPVTSGTAERFTSVKWYNGEFVAITQGGGTATSPNGMTWTWKAAPQNLFFAGGVGMEMFIHSDGLYAYMRGVTAQQIVTKYLGGGDWELISLVHTSTTSAGATASVPAGIFFGAPVGTVTPNYLAAGSNMAGVIMTATGPWVVAARGQRTWDWISQVNSSTDDGWHRISIVGTSVPDQPYPQFMFKTYYDGVEVASTGPHYLETYVTGQRLWACSSSFSWNFMSDVVVTDFSGTRNVGLTNDMQVRPRRLTTDVQAEWARLPAGAASNAAAAQGNGSVLFSTSSVQSSAVGSTDQYGAGALTPVPGYRIAGVQATAVFQRAGIPTPTVQLSVVEGGSSLPVKSATLSGSNVDNVPLTAVYQTKLDGQAWTPESVSAATVQLRQSA